MPGFSVNRGYASRRGGHFIEIEGLDEIIASLRGGINEMHKLMRDIMRGEVGQAMLAYMLPQVPIGRKRVPAGRANMVARTRLYDMGERGGVEVGYRGEMVANPGVQGARFQLGAWIESGTKPHWIRPRNGKMLYWVDENGYSHFSRGHKVSGIRPHLIALQTLQSQEWRVLVAMENRLNTYFVPTRVAA